MHYISFCLPQQRHPFHFTQTVTAGQPVYIHATCYGITPVVPAVPDNAIASLRLHLIHQTDHFLAQQVVDRQRDAGLMWYVVGYGS